MQQEITIIEIDWTEATGSRSSVGSPYLFGWLRASYVRPGLISDGRVVVLAQKNPSAGWDRYQGEVTLSEADTLVSALALLGIPERAPRIESIADSSDTWSAGSVRVAVAGQVQTFIIESWSTGFRGGEAEGLRALFRRILDLCGCGYQQTMFGPTEDDPESQPFYHGTKADLKLGELIEPGYNSNYGTRKKAAFVYLTATLDAATWGAELAVGEGSGRIYIVEPTGPIEDDPNLTDRKFPGNPTKSYRTRDPLRVTGEVVEWEGHSPEQLKAMNDNLERLRELGIEAIED